MNIFPLLSWQFLAFFILFLFSIYISFYLPGALFLSKKKLGLGLHMLLSFSLGIAVWGFLGYILGYLHLRFLTYIYLFVVLLAAYRINLVNASLLRESKKWLFNHPVLVGFVIVGVLVQLGAVVGSGVMYSDGVRFFGVNRADGIMHTAFIQSIINSFPPIEPGSYGHPITNYHFWSDMIIADLVRVWGLPISHTFFQYFPLLVSVLTALGGYLVVRRLGFAERVGVWSIFFLFFAGDATYALTMLFLHKLSFATPTLDNGASQFLNMPNALARVILLSGIISFTYWFKERTKFFWGIITVLLFGVLVGIKIYYGIFVVLGFGLVAIFVLVRSLLVFKKEHGLGRALQKTFSQEKYMILGGVMLCIISFVIFFPTNKNAGGLGWYPLEWPKIFLGTDVLNWQSWWLRLQVYQSAHNVGWLVILYSLAILICLVCIHGTRLIGLLLTKSSYKKLGWEMSIFLIPGLILFHILGLFTLQASGGLNVFNFFVVATVILSIFSAIVMGKYSFSLKKPLSVLLIAVIVIATLPRVVFETSRVIQASLNSQEESFLVSKDELNAFTFIRNKTPKGFIIQSHPNNPDDFITPYVSYFSDRLSYLSGIKLQETHNQPLKEREGKIKELFSSPESVSFFGHARTLGINLLYLRKVPEERLPYALDKTLFTKIYENKSVIVYRINIDI